MKTSHLRKKNAGYALMIVMGVTAVSLVILAATMQRTATVANLNERSNQYLANANAAEAATEKVFARMAYDFQAYGLGAVKANLSMYRTNVPVTSENSYWGNFVFSNGKGKDNETYIDVVTPSYTGPLPSQYPGLKAIASPIYRIVSNVRSKNGNTLITNAVQEDVLLALVPITTYAIFYNSLLEFSTCATMIVNGRVHANSDIYVGSSSTLTFNGTVTATGKISMPKNNGFTPSGNGNVIYHGTPDYKNNVPAVALSINMTNTHSMIEVPPNNESPSSTAGEQRMYNLAHVVLTVTDTSVTARVQNSIFGQVPGADPSPVILSTNLSSNAVSQVFPFLNVNNTFLDQREDKTATTTEIDVQKYKQWIANTPSVTAKFPGNTYPTILYVTDNRTVTSKKFDAVRLKNGASLPSNGGLGFTVATPNPLYVWGDYNAPDPASTDTSHTVPAALMSDALTILSSKWKDSTSTTQSSTGPTASANTTVNAAILTGIVPSTGSGTSQFSGGVHNLPRLLEDWSSSTLWLNTSIVNLFNSKVATGKFVTPGSGSYYVPPTRRFSFDENFLDPAKQPPGVPCALVPIRYNWAVPPANTVTYNVTP